MSLLCTANNIVSIEYWCDLEIWVRGHSRLLKTVPFKSLGKVSYSYSIATMVVSLAVSAQYTNVTDSQPDIQTLHDGKKLTRVCSIFAMVSSTSSLACSTLDCGTEPCWACFITTACLPHRNINVRQSASEWAEFHFPPESSHFTFQPTGLLLRPKTEIKG